MFLMRNELVSWELRKLLHSARALWSNVSLKQFAYWLGPFPRVFQLEAASSFQTGNPTPARVFVSLFLLYT
jgi:hypothetical protein